MGGHPAGLPTTRILPLTHAHSPAMHKTALLFCKLLMLPATPNSAMHTPPQDGTPTFTSE